MTTPSFAQISKSTPSIVLKISDLSIAFDGPAGRRAVVNNMSLEVGRGQIVGLVGESGSGKTLISLAVLGLLPNGASVTSGEIQIDDDVISRLPMHAMRTVRGRRISMIFQDPMSSLDPVFPCGDQIADAILMHENVGRRTARARAHALLVRLKLPDPDRAMRAYPHELSGGQCQRIMIAMAVACRPSVIIADEPTTALDVTVQRQVLDLLQDLNREVGAAILLITHDLGVVRDVADRVVVMCRGEKVEEASTDDLFARPQSAYTRALIAAMPTLGDRRQRLPSVGEAEGSAARLEARPKASSMPADASLPPVLKVENITKIYHLKSGLFRMARPFTAVDDVSLTIASRTTLGLVGESGCGKSTLSRLILQTQRATSGHVWFNGEDLTRVDKGRLLAARRDLALVFQNPYGSLNPRETVEELISAPLVINGRRGEAAQAVTRLLDAVGFTFYRKKQISTCVFRWSATAHSDRPRSRVTPATVDLRRGDLGAGCFRTGAGA